MRWLALLLVWGSLLTSGADPRDFTDPAEYYSHLAEDRHFFFKHHATIWAVLTREYHQALVDEDLWPQGRPANFGKLQLLPLLESDEQRVIREAWEFQMNDRGYARIIVVKARKVYCSTEIQNLGQHELIFQPGSRMLTMAHISDATEELFLIGKTVYENLDADLQPPLEPGSNFSLSEGVTYDFGVDEWGNHVKSFAKCQTAGGHEGKDRGKTPTFRHDSEVPSWDTHRVSTSGADVAQASLASIPDQAGTSFLEATGKGPHGIFYNMVMSAHRNERGNEYELIFFGVHEHKPYVFFDSPDEEDREDDRLLARRMHAAWETDDHKTMHRCAIELGYDSLPPDAYKLLVDDGKIGRLKLMPEQVRWWERRLISECDGKVERALQEYPFDLEDAFIAGSRSFFPLRKVRSRIDAIQKSPPEYQRVTLWAPKGTRDVKTIPRGDWKIYQPPERGRTYIIGGDVASGGTTAENDYGALFVLDRWTKKQVAGLYARTSPKDLAEQIAYASYWYNDALAAPENREYGRAVLMHLEDNFPDVRLYHHFKGPDTDSGNWSKTKGFDTSMKNRPLIFDALREDFRDGAVELMDLELLGEMMTVVTGGPKDRPEHAPGHHDDYVVAAGITLVIDRELADTADDPLAPPGVERPEWCTGGFTGIDTALVDVMKKGSDDEEGFSWF